MRPAPRLGHGSSGRGEVCRYLRFREGLSTEGVREDPRPVARHPRASENRRELQNIVNNRPASTRPGVRPPERCGRCLGPGLRDPGASHPRPSRSSSAAWGKHQCGGWGHREGKGRVSVQDPSMLPKDDRVREGRVSQNHLPG